MKPFNQCLNHIWLRYDTDTNHLCQYQHRTIRILPTSRKDLYTFFSIYF